MGCYYRLHGYNRLGVVGRNLKLEVNFLFVGVTILMIFRFGSPIEPFRSLLSRCSCAITPGGA